MTELDNRIRGAVDDLLQIPDLQERLAWLVDQAKRAPGLPREAKTEAYRIVGCISPVWLRAQIVEGRLWLEDDAESPLVRALVHFMVRLYSGATLDEIKMSTLDPIAEAELMRSLSPTRQNGLGAVRAQIRRWAETA